MKPIGIILANLGTPRAPTPGAVGAYLREFLMDPLVIDKPYPLRWLLVHGIIVPRRRWSSAVLYRNIWTDRGSPLLLNTEELARGLSERLGDGYRVRVAMRYGAPSLDAALEEMKRDGIEDIMVSPQYPQYALATYESTLLHARSAARRTHPAAALRFLPPFFQNQEFLNAYREVLVDFERTHRPEHYLFSYHGLPVRHVRKTATRGRCYRLPGCCASLEEGNRLCYRAQCFWTSRTIAREAAIEDSRFSVGFQSRLGRAPWIEPYSDVLLGQLAGRGVRRLAVACPSFTADCLETLEEVGIRFREQFLRLGGQELHLVPCLNAHPRWVEGLARMITGAAAKVTVGLR